MGFSLLTHPKEVLKGYKAEVNTKGIVDLKITKEALLKLSIPELKSLIKKDETKKINWFQFTFWSVISVLIVLFPFLLVIFGISYFL